MTSKTGRRRIEVGPTTVLLDYDEGLEILSLSTGTPKTTVRALLTPYLQIDNNQVSDVVMVDTLDHVGARLQLSYRVDFEGDPLKWFTVENYVKLLCDHVRSVLKGELRKLSVEDFYSSSTGRIRDLILGPSPKDRDGAPGERRGMAFANGMRIVDVDVISVALNDDKIRGLLEAAQHDVVRTNIELSTLGRELGVIKQREQIARDTAEVKAQTKLRNDELARELATSDLATALARIANTLRETGERRKQVEVETEIDAFKTTARIERVKRERDQELAFAAIEQDKKIELLRAEAETAVQRFTAASGNFSEALVQLGRHETLVKVAEAWNTQRIIEGESLGDTLSRLFNNTPLKGLVDKLTLNGSAH